MSLVEKRKLNADNKLFLIIFFILLTVFIFSNNGHRYTSDEDMAQKQTMYIVTGNPSPTYVQGNSTVLYEYPLYYPNSHLPPCKNAILCSKSDIGHSITEVPFVFINHYLHIITSNTVTWDSNDFDDPSYVYWRNSLDPDFTFLQLFYGPIFSALSVGVFFLICRTLNFDQRNSILLTLLYGFTTLLWPYSRTSFNMVSSTFFILLGFLFFKKFQRNNSVINLVLCASSLGFDYLIRQDAILFISPLFLLLIYNLRNQNKKIIKFFSFIIPPIFFYYVSTIIFSLRYTTNTATQVASLPGIIGSYVEPYQFLVNISGLFLSPGVGLLIFCPIFLTIFFSFPDFFRKNKADCILFLSFTALILFFYAVGQIGGWWHGLVAWGPRYLVTLSPFLLLPLGSSMQQRKSRIIKISIISLGVIGFFFNLVYVIQDVSWFVWGNASLHTGLFGIEKNGLFDLNIHPATIWTFEFSPLTQSIITAFTHLQPDIFLLKAFGLGSFGIIFTTVMGSLIYVLLNLLRKNVEPLKKME